VERKDLVDRGEILVHGVEEFLGVDGQVFGELETDGCPVLLVKVSDAVLTCDAVVGGLGFEVAGVEVEDGGELDCGVSQR
jgi:hypothetical protein